MWLMMKLFLCLMFQLLLSLRLFIYINLLTNLNWLCFYIFRLKIFQGVYFWLNLLYFRRNLWKWCIFYWFFLNFFLKFKITFKCCLFLHFWLFFLAFVTLSLFFILWLRCQCIDWWWKLKIFLIMLLSSRSNYIHLL